MDAPYLYIVQFWIRPDQEAALVAWLRDKHLQEVTDEPGFRLARMIKLEQKSADGWQGYQNIYELESKAALEAYFAGSARERFTKESARFQDAMRADRAWGQVVLAATHARR
jgi:antibiotic biosynthesis monooxygenase (ABM) superfamily enzyme